LQYKTIVFDLDGTISDPFVGISRSINYALESLDYDPVDPERIRPLIGPPLTEIFEILLGALRERDMLGLVDKYRERYASIGYSENRIYDDIPTIIEQLAGRGYRMGICTSKRADYAQRTGTNRVAGREWIDGQFRNHDWRSCRRHPRWKIE
jgi:phosphoglycolate phosphatase